MIETINYKLKKPESNDYVSIDTLNSNMDILDQELKKASQKVDKAVLQRNVTLSVSGWSSTYPHTQEVSVSGITANDDLKVVGLYIPDGATATQVKAWIKAASCLMSNVSGTAAGKIVFKAYKKPVSEFTVVVEGG